VNAQHWEDLVVALEKSSLGFPADKLVELSCHENDKCTPQGPTSNVDRVVYKDIQDILPLLARLVNSSPSESVSGLAFIWMFKSC
jgi:hypothetical protein